VNTQNVPPRAWTLLLVALGLAALGSAWSLLGTSNCSSCHSAGSLFGGKSLAATGVVYYSALLAIGVAAGPTLFVYSGVLIAAGVHAGLVIVLVRLELLCGPCLATAGAALLCLISAIACDPANAFRASLVSPGAAGALQLWFLFSGALPAAAESRSQVEQVAREDLSRPPVARGTVRMVIYTRPDCGYCIQLERDVLPVLIREFGPRLDVELRSAKELPGIPTPTIILSGAGGRRFFPGLPETGELRRAIETLMGDKGHGHETVLETSR
jgi:hypothetical protein